MKLLNLNTNHVLADEVWQAHSFFKRLKGLMFTKEFGTGCALHIKPCQSIHSFFMNYPIDVLYINEWNEVVAFDQTFPPGKVGKKYRHVKSVLELPAGTIEKSNIEIGHKISFKNE
ncbi:hypothetical protein HNQ94_003612 [Salirhabdus euzebyi]|uniref:DUF192 domain-containing protein n=1 Tax=Salirhabdus euzebyi TaxID=394506 RepID=A0A841QA56_9BACI|nr:DUF192 domain-containing protein [Salirhabdus euzebyi]MBB6455117.1 hypothetical protein [Salirhabdus euzebyi]